MPHKFISKMPQDVIIGGMPHTAVYGKIVRGELEEFLLKHHASKLVPCDENGIIMVKAEEPPVSTTDSHESPVVPDSNEEFPAPEPNEPEKGDLLSTLKAAKSEDDIRRFSKAELVTLCKQLGIPTSRKQKGDLVSALAAMIGV